MSIRREEGGKNKSPGDREDALENRPRSLGPDPYPSYANFHYSVIRPFRAPAISCAELSRWNLHNVDFQLELTDPIFL